ncbi:MAG: DUF354 domain-containing protein [Candidatus Paceibacterota bacterium]
MKVIIDIGHPAHVHYFKNIIRIIESKGGRCIVTSRDKEIAFKLLNHESIPYISRGSGGNGAVGKTLYMFKATKFLSKIIKKERPDIAISFSSPYLAQASYWNKIPHIAFDDTEHAKLSHKLCWPFCEAIYTPSAYRLKSFKNQKIFDGYMELSYLHPDYFTPDPNIIKEEGVTKDEKYVILRFVSWGAVHDRGHNGFSDSQKEKIVRNLSKCAKVLISSEAELPESLKPHKINLPVHQIHHLIAYASLLYGESATMASEAAILGTPAIFHDKTGRGYTDEQEKKYGLVYNYSDSLVDQESSLNKALEIIQTDNSKKKYEEKRHQLIKDKIDVTSFMTWVIENYPESIKDDAICKYLNGNN